MIGYVARDEDGNIYLHRTEPVIEEFARRKAYYSEYFFVLFDDDFPELKDITFDNSPVKVEINIKKV